MKPMSQHAEEPAGDSEDRLQFRMEVFSNNGDALEKMGIVDPSEKGFLRRLFDLFL